MRDYVFYHGCEQAERPQTTTDVYGYHFSGSELFPEKRAEGGGYLSLPI